MQERKGEPHLMENMENGGGHLAQGTGADEPFITELWQEAFGDSEAYIREFLEVHRNTKEDPDRVFLWKQQGLSRTMLFALPAKIRQNGKIKNARYLYAIATKKDCRGRKYLRQMLPELKKVFGKDCLLFLVPEPEVIPYYESLGFELREALPGFVLESEEGREAPLMAASEKLVLKEITDVSYYCRLRRENLEDRDCVLWEEHEISWALRDISIAQGRVYVVECRYGNYLLAGIRREREGKSCFQVIEETLPEQVWEESGTELMRKLGCVKIVQNKLSYMIEKGKEEGSLYLSLALNG